MLTSKLNTLRENTNRAYDSYKNEVQKRDYNCFGQQKEKLTKELDELTKLEDEYIKQLQEISEKLANLKFDRNKVFSKLSEVPDNNDAEILRTESEYRRLNSEIEKAEEEIKCFQIKIFNYISSKIKDVPLDKAIEYIDAFCDSEEYKEDCSDEFRLRLKFGSPLYKQPITEEVLNMIKKYNSLDSQGIEINKRNSNLDIIFNDSEFEAKYLKYYSNINIRGISGSVASIILALLEYNTFSSLEDKLDYSMSNILLSDKEEPESLLKRRAGIGSNTIRAYYFDTNEGVLNFVPACKLYDSYGLLQEISEKFGYFDLSYSVSY